MGTEKNKLQTIPIPDDVPKDDIEALIKNKDRNRAKYHRSLLNSRKLVDDDELRKINFSMVRSVDAFREKVNSIPGISHHSKFLIFERLAYMHYDKPASLLMYAAGYPEHKVKSKKFVDHTTKRACSHMDKAFPDKLDRRDRVRELMTEHGITMDFIFQRMKEGMDAKRPVNVNPDGEGWRTEERPDMAERRAMMTKAIEMAEIQPAEEDNVRIQRMEIHIHQGILPDEKDDEDEGNIIEADAEVIPDED